MALEFDPNAKTKPSMPKFATYIPNRTPQFKIHTTRGHAKNAIGWEGWSFPRGGILYEWQNEEWVETFRYEPPTTCCECGGPLGAYNNWEVADYTVSKWDRQARHHSCRR